MSRHERHFYKRGLVCKNDAGFQLTF